MCDAASVFVARSPGDPTELAVSPKSTEAWTVIRYGTVACLGAPPLLPPPRPLRPYSLVLPPSIWPLPPPQKSLWVLRQRRPINHKPRVSNFERVIITAATASIRLLGLGPLYKVVLSGLGPQYRVVLSGLGPLYRVVFSGLGPQYRVVLLGLGPRYRVVLLGLGPLDRVLLLGLDPLYRVVLLGLGPLNNNNNKDDF